MDISIKYDPKSVEKKRYHYWMKGNYFSSYPDDRIPYTIVMPPPNITGVLHIGHMLNNTIQDVLIRYARMKGYNACWIPGTDHASIATEAKVVDQLKKQGFSKSFLGRDKFLNYVLEWAKKHKNIIFDQLKKLGCSCDWKRTQFTMNQKLSKSVSKIFIDLYEHGYIYRDYHVVNWDPEAKTTLSDEEVVYKERIGQLYYLKYQIKGEKNYVTVATTRPETIFGDTALCFHPSDSRYFHLTGKYAKVPIINKYIPIIQDSYVDKDFGTGCLKITPAHDIHDKNIADKYKLDIIDIFNEDATLNEKGLHYKGMNRFEVRKKIIEELKQLGFLVRIEKYNHKIGFSERTLSIVEQRLSLQWFLKMKEISLPAIEAVKNGDIQFYPKKLNKIYFQWMNQIRDWNISRQLWWGHRLPVYYYGNKTNDFVVAESLEQALKKARKKSNNSYLSYDEIWQDPDVLDTWFSSWLFPLSVFDGICHPHNHEICYYYPTEDIVTGSDILFFWVARMIIAGLFFQKKKPFKRVFFTGIIRDSKNQKISKSLNNSPDPMDLMNQYGADAVRMGLMLKTSAGQDFHFDEKICLQGRNFSNKIWNAFRLIKSWKMQENKEIPDSSLIAIKWLKNRFYYVLEIFEKHFQEYRLDESLMVLYKFIWYDFCSYFLEIIKPIHGNRCISKIEYLSSVKFFENILKLLHPYMPFLSEEIWNLIEKRKPEEALIISSWPEKKYYDYEMLVSFEKVTQIISKIRNIRNQCHISYQKSFVLFAMRKKEKEEKEYDSIILKLANLSEIVSILEKPKNTPLFSFFLNTDQFFLSLTDESHNSSHVDIMSIEKKIQYFQNLLSSIQKNLSNDKYVTSVPENILSKERKKESDTLKKIYQLEKYLESLKK
ncbi:valine-tRNA ligase [Blattabacterium sp. (Blattella germanica) str. Bge]|uniref:valine--tRNA ligase n=1 Tax=Blattabacterium sp. (Blattella germanica) TaxID=624186 RepID=UPI0001BB61FF|nr:valine--tRNA ligase [Blattabacterium sp. (Blattella germanica)]ACY40457.1 valine-tRNA ligase [Blattabacterium sp. (Blattella germanica) str. Bge]